ncbi:MAG: N,N'-diacetylchitobiose phosphorylase [Clostridiales bacterium]|nr:N,N'-diacetylchitobiose phosphorylase [Clostridiales bacterium]
MQYGFFDDVKREYVITNPNTPAPWANYLGSPDYGAIITVNAGGYSFVKSGAAGRILRYTFNQFDEPGRYIYLRDEENGDFWSASWRPVAKPLDQYQTECHHGTSYTEFVSQYAGVESRALYYVPMGATHEVWRLTLENKSDRERTISAFGYCEFTCENFYTQDMVNLQYTQFITRTDFKGDFILQHINEFCHVKPDGSNGSERFFGVAGAPVASFTGSREQFLGRNRFTNPRAVENGACDNTLNYNSNPCGALQVKIILQPGEKKSIAFMLGQKSEYQARDILDQYKDVDGKVGAELHQLISYWHGELDHLKIHTPDARFNSMVNTWNAFQCFTTFVWSRAASLFYCGERNGYGYRDTVQDIQGIIHLDPALAKKQITFMLSAQVHHGGGLPLVKFDHHAGHENTPEDESYVRETGHPHYRADDAMWLFPTVYKYIAETGDVAYLDEVIPFANKDEGTVREHLKRAIDFTMNHLGPHGMPAGLHADWNDCLRLGAEGESTFVAFQFYYALQIMQKFCQDEPEYVAYLKETAAKLLKTLNEECFEGDRFIRGFTDKGAIIGSKNHKEAAMWLNPQSWAVISGAATAAQADAILDTANELLNTPYGLQVMYPPYRYEAFDGALMLLFNPGTKENGSVFCQIQGWAILAEALRGHGNRAFQYFAESSPASFNENADLRCIEPYVHGQFIEGKDSPFAGRGHVHWLTGTASTVMVGCVEGILGLRPAIDGIAISPAIPAQWDGFTAEKMFRGKKLNIRVDNSAHKEGNPEKYIINGVERPAGLIKESELADVNDILVIM